MNVVVLTHPSCLAYDTGPGHPERAARIDAILDMLDNDMPDIAIIEDIEPAPDSALLLAHTQTHIETLEARMPADGSAAMLDGDTVLSQASLAAARFAAGAACMAVDMVADGRATAAFCATRPPGHHAESEKAMGFCLFNHVYIAARHAQEKHGARRVAIVDFDVHHGNGTAEITYGQRRNDILAASSHQFPLYPGTGDPDVDDNAGGLIVDVPLAAGTGSDAFRAAYSDVILPRLRAFAPDFLILAAGFDAHKADPVGGLNLDEEDFRWVTGQLGAICPRVVSILEGGYDLTALSESVHAHLEALQNIGKT